MHAKWLRQYAPLVEEGTWAWLEIKEMAFVRGGRLPSDVVASAFANRQMYLVLANYGGRSVVIETAQDFETIEEPRVGTRWELGARSLLILNRCKLRRPHALVPD